MNISEWIVITVFIVALLFINRFLSKRYQSKVDPDKLEGVRLIVLAFLLGTFCFTAFEGTHGIGLQVVLVVLTAHFIQRIYKWMNGSLYHKNQKRQL
ncbi:MAG: hypothetical protein JST63_18985 [Bacteroidetes bacterium]|nr:hypothetical protein [Bacteroidota bacterium]